MSSEQPGTTGKDIGNNIRSARKRLGWRQDDLANAMGVARSSICNWERGRVPDALTLRAAAEALGVNPSMLLGFTDANPDVGERLRRMLQAEGRALADHITGFGQETWEQIFAGKVFLSPELVEALASAYRVSPGWLRSGLPEQWSPSLLGAVSTRMRFIRVLFGFSLEWTPHPSLESSEEVNRLASTLIRNREVLKAMEVTEALAQREILQGQDSPLNDWVLLFDVLISTASLKPHECPWHQGDWKAWLLGPA